ncbi:MAG: hypothetical protein ACFE9T_10385 [Promethearchaeota archaeon]
MFLSVRTYEVQGELRTSQSKVFHNMYANYTFDVSLAGEYNTTFTYSRVSGDIYNVTWDFPGPTFSTWLESKQTRIISNASGTWAFNSGTHTPIWQFTNLSLGNFTLIGVDGEPDHLFEVVGEYNVTLTGIGTYETWVLQDTVFAGSIAFYEKTTGLLMAGLFYFSGGTEDYTLILTSTNMFSHYESESKEIPGYDLLLLIPAITIISLMIILRKRKRL